MLESCLHQSDSSANELGLRLTDSNIRSLLVRALNEAKGKSVQSVEASASEKDQFLPEALSDLISLRSAMLTQLEQSDDSMTTSILPISDWIALQETIKDSCALHTGSEPGSRGYLEFLRDFIQNAGKAK